MYKSTISNEARLDLNEMWLDIFDITKSEEFSDNFTDSFFSAFEKIAKNPNIGESRSKLKRDLRKWTHKKYIIYYTLTGDQVQIERIIWGRRQQRI